MSGKVVMLTVLAVGLTLVFGVATFAALTRPPRKPPPPGGSVPARPAGSALAPGIMDW